MTSAMAQKIGVSLAYSDDVFLTTLREAMEKRAKELGVTIQFEHAQGDIGKQLSQIQNFVAQKMNAIVVNPVDSMATPNMTKLATNAGIPLVYVNLKPAEETLPQGVAYVGSDENVSGRLQGEEIARLLNNKGNLVIRTQRPRARARWRYPADETSSNTLSSGVLPNVQLQTENLIHPLT
jgi:inositol transport system substrate-binding protein